MLRGPNNSLLVCPRDGVVTSTLFWLHGLGDSAGFYWSFFHSQNTPVPPDCKVRLLTAPTIKLTINGGEYITAWYDILNSKPDETSVCEDDVIRNSEYIK